MDLIKKAKWGYIVVSIIIIMLGLILILFPEISALAICYVIGGIITLFGIIKLIGYFSKDLFRLAFQFDFALGIFALISGILLLIHPTDVVKIVPVIIGLFVLMDGVFKIQTSRDAYLFGMKNWWSILVLAILTCIGGLFLIINPFNGAKALTILLGATLIIDGIQNIIVVSYTVKAVRSEDERPDTIYIEHDEKR